MRILRNLLCIFFLLICFAYSQVDSVKASYIGIQPTIAGTLFNANIHTVGFTSPTPPYSFNARHYLWTTFEGDPTAGSVSVFQLTETHANAQVDIIVPTWAEDYINITRESSRIYFTRIKEITNAHIAIYPYIYAYTYFYTLGIFQPGWPIVITPGPPIHTKPLNMDRYIVRTQVTVDHLNHKIIIPANRNYTEISVQPCVTVGVPPNQVATILFRWMMDLPVYLQGRVNFYDILPASGFSFNRANILISHPYHFTSIDPDDRTFRIEFTDGNNYFFYIYFERAILCDVCNELLDDCICTVICTICQNDPCTCCATCGNNPCTCPVVCAVCGNDPCTCPVVCTTCGTDPCTCPVVCITCGNDPCVCCTTCGTDPCTCSVVCTTCGNDPCSCCTTCGNDPCTCLVVCTICQNDPCTCCTTCGNDPCTCPILCTICGNDPCTCCTTCGNDPCTCPVICTTCGNDPCTCPILCTTCGNDPCTCCTTCGNDPCTCPVICTTCGNDPCTCCTICNQHHCTCPIICTTCGNDPCTCPVVCTVCGNNPCTCPILCTTCGNNPCTCCITCNQHPCTCPVVCTTCGNDPCTCPIVCAICDNNPCICPVVCSTCGNNPCTCLIVCAVCGSNPCICTQDQRYTIWGMYIPHEENNQTQPVINRGGFGFLNVTNQELNNRAREYGVRYLYTPYYTTRANVEIDVIDMSFIDSMQIVTVLTIDQYYMTVNGRRVNLDAAPFIDIRYNRTLVPLAAIAESLLVDVRWDAERRTVIMDDEGHIRELMVDWTIPGGMGRPMIVNARTMVPIRYIAETFGAEVLWNSQERTVTVIR